MASASIRGRSTPRSGRADVDPRGHVSATTALADAIGTALRARPRRRRPAPAAWLLATTVLFAGVVSMPARADSWTGSEAGDWFDGDNWFDGSVPGIADNVDINLADFSPRIIGGGAFAGEITIGRNTVGDLYIGGGGRLDSDRSRIGNDAGSQGSVTVDGFGAAWSVNDFLFVGNAGTGSLTVVGSAELGTAGFAWLGAERTGHGTVTVSGPRSRWIGSDELAVGYWGTGELTIENGGAVSNTDGAIGMIAGSNGTVRVSGAGSDWTNNGDLFVGRAGTGSLTIQEGGAVSTAFDSHVGFDAGSDGTVLVDGAGSNWTTDGQFYVGNSGNGRLTISGGGVASATSSLIGGGVGSTGTVLVDGAGSRWTNNGPLAVGVDGEGTLTIRNGGAVSAGLGYIGLDSGSGTVLVEGADSELAYSADLSVGRTGLGVLTVQGGGTVSALNGYVGYNAGSDGTLLVDGAGSSWTGSEGLYVGIDSVGALTVRNGGAVSSQYAYLGIFAGGTGTATVDGAGSSWINSSELHIGYQGSGQFTIGNGGAVSGTIGSIATDAFSSGTVRVEGAGSHWTSSDALYIGRLGTGTLTVADGGAVDSAGEVVIAEQAGSAGTLNIGAAAGDPAAAAGSFKAPALAFGDGTGTLNFNHTANDYVFAPALTGNGTVNVFAGTTIVTGAGSNTGTTNVNGGTLRVEGALGDTTTTVFDTATLGGSGSIAGDVTVLDGGTLAPGASAGTLTLGSLTLDEGAILDYELGQSGVIGGGVNDLIEIGGDLSLDGTLNITDIGGFGAGVYRLMNYGGTLTDNTLELGALPTSIETDDLFLQTAIDGQVNLVSSAGLTLTFWDGPAAAIHDNGAVDGGDGTWVAGDRSWTQADGALNGHWDNGEFAVFGGAGGTVTVLGEQAVAGLQFMSDYTLAPGADGALDIGAAQTNIRVDPGVTATIDVAIGGDGGLVKLDTGTLVLTAANTYGGDTALLGGTLRIDGSLGGATTVATGALLTGTGTVGSVDNAGTLAPGDSIGTLHLTGDYIHRAGATLLAEIEPGGGSDLLDIAGSATIEGGTVEVTKAPGQYAGGTRYTLIDAAGGVTGTFDALDQDLPFLDLLLGYDANHVYLDVQRNDVGFDIVCGDGSFNQCQVAGALDRAAEQPAIAPDLTDVLTEVTTLDLDQARAGFDRLSGEAHASLAGAMLEGHALYGQAVSRRIAERREAPGTDRLHGGAWVRGYGMGSDLDGDGNAHGADVDVIGVAAGVDAWVGESWLIGAGINTLRVDADFRAGDGGEADARNVALYTSVRGARAYLDGVASYAWWDSEVRRRIEVGALARGARSEYGSHRFATHLEAGLDYDLGGSTLQPLLSVEHSRLSTQGFRERGAGDVDLIGRSEAVTRTVAALGLRWTGEFGDGAWTFAPTAQARWLRTFGDRYAEFELAFAGAPEIGYRVRGVTVPENRGLFGVGLMARRGDDLDLFVDADYQAGEGFDAYGLSAGVRWRW